MIDIAQPDWRERLKAIQDATEGKDKANDPHQGIDRIILMDHGRPGTQDFGSTKLTPNSPEWQTITSSVRPRGDVVLMGCEVAKKDWRGNGPDYLNELYRSSSATRSPTIHAYDENVRHRIHRGKPSLTAGKQNSVSIDGYKIQ